MTSGSTRRRFLEATGSGGRDGRPGRVGGIRDGEAQAPDRPGHAAQGRRLASVYYYLSHAYHIVGRFLDGFPVYDGRPDPCTGRRSRSPACSSSRSPGDRPGPGQGHGTGSASSPTIADALTLGTGKLAVDAVLLIAEHGEYPYNEKLQKLYPRGKYFREVLDVFAASGRAVPVFIDKHLSYSRTEAEAMIKAAAARRSR